MTHPNDLVRRHDCVPLNHISQEAKSTPQRLPAKSLIALAFALTACTQLVAQQAAVTLDPQNTTVNFTLDASFHTVHGLFRIKSSAIQFDTSSGAASGAIVVDATSGETGNQKRDRNMHRDVLHSQRYPEIVFIPTHVIGKVLAEGESQIQVEGIMKLHGADHPMTLPFDLQSQGTDLHAATHFVIPYVAWGLKNPSNVFLHVADKVEVSVVAKGRLSPRVAAGSD
jgi:polyisoprenoid-binding protein YceI